MKRKIDTELAQWAQDQTAPPLLLRGARRVGKTHALKALGTTQFENMLYCDFQANLEQLTQVFSGQTNVERIVNSLSLLYNQPVSEQSTLIVLDEIQLSDTALNSLRFFAQSNYRVAATGSQLGVTLKGRQLPFPSDVRQLTLHPMDFEEFCWAMGEERLASAIRESFASRSKFLLHSQALDLQRRYVVSGGMPRVVDALAQATSPAQAWQQVQERQEEILQTYVSDMALYAQPAEVARILAVWRSIPAQLAREGTRKFKYTDVQTGGRERQFKGPITWLQHANLVHLVEQTNEAAAPLLARNDGSFFKVYLADVGLMYHRYNLQPQAYLDDVQREALSARFRGALAENFVMQALAANGLDPFYWCPKTSSSAEVEFVLQDRRGRIVPIEVKSGTNVRSKSLIAYQQRAQAPTAIRISEKNFGLENGIFSVPTYAAFCLTNEALLGL